MADLRAALPGRFDRRQARGQILLVTALVLGVSFVALALILNSAIFTENLASRGDTTGASEVVTYQGNLEQGVGSILTYETHNASSGEDHGIVFDRIQAGVDDTNEVLVRRHARRGAIANVSIVDHREGSRVFQTNSARNFSSGNGDRNWTLASDVDNTRNFRMNVSRTGLPTGCTLLTDCFTLEVDDGSDNWQLSVADTTGGVEVRVDNGTSTASCNPVDEPFVPIDVTSGTVAGEPCSALAFASGLSSSYSVSYAHGDEIEGTYTLVVDDEGVADTPPAHATGPGDPSVTAAVYDLTLGFEYETADIFVGQEIRVAPGEPDGR